MRTLCTTENIYNANIPVIVYDGIKEHPQSKNGVITSSKTVLMERFPEYDFSI